MSDDFRLGANEDRDVPVDDGSLGFRRTEFTENGTTNTRGHGVCHTCGRIDVKEPFRCNAGHISCQEHIVLSDEGSRCVIDIVQEVASLDEFLVLVGLAAGWTVGAIGKVTKLKARDIACRLVEKEFVKAGGFWPFESFSLTYDGLGALPTLVRAYRYNTLAVYCIGVFGQSYKDGAEAWKGRLDLETGRA